VYSVPDGGPYPNCETGPCWIVAFWYASDSIVSAPQPISFDLTTTPLTSHYTADELAAVTGAATTLCITNAEVLNATVPPRVRVLRSDLCL
jgi:hypothetical protein